MSSDESAALIPPRNTCTSSALNSPVTSRPTSRAASPHPSEDDVPTNVCRVSQLEGLPSECLTGEKDRPLQHFDESGSISKYTLQPMYSVIFVLVVETMERLSFYGLNYTQASYLTGAYDRHWNAGMDSIPASSYVALSVAVAYTTPFLGYFFDSLFGDYWSILVGCLVFYVPGLLLIAMTTIPGLLGDTFNRTALKMGLLFLWPTGTGTVKSLVNVFGARQFHPLLQSSLIEAYYVNFYMCINIGALIGGVAVPVVAQSNVAVAYFIPVLMLSIGVCLFILGTPRYVKRKASVDWRTLFKRKKAAAIYKTYPPTDAIPLTVIMRVSLLIVPFSIAYSQMATTFIVQGTVMKRAFGFIDAASMNNADAIAVLVFGYLVGNLFYPWCARKGIKIPTTYKFAFGSALGALAIAWALLVEFLIHRTYAETGERVSIMWQAMSYILIGVGEIFAVSAAYEVAFTASPPDKKVLSSAVNLFCIGGLPNMICIGLYQACEPWFRNSKGTTKISKIHEYTTSHVSNYFWVLFLISLAGVAVNVLPSVRAFVESIEEKASDMIRTPKTPIRPPKRVPEPDEETTMLKIKRHQYYLKYGSGPSLYKHGSMRAGPTMSHTVGAKPSQSHLKRTTLSKLYQSNPQVPVVAALMGPDGQRIALDRADAPQMPPRIESEVPQTTSSGDVEEFSE